MRQCGRNARIGPLASKGNYVLEVFIELVLLVLLLPLLIMLDSCLDFLGHQVDGPRM